MRVILTAGTKSLRVNAYEPVAAFITRLMGYTDSSHHLICHHPNCASQRQQLLLIVSLFVSYLFYAIEMRAHN